MMPSGKMHIGHKMIVDQLVWYQEKGADIYIPIADLESYSAREIEFEESRKLAVSEYITNYIALGLDFTKECSCLSSVRKQNGAGPCIHTRPKG